MADVKELLKRRKRLIKKAHTLETNGRYDDAVAVHQELDRVLAALDEARRAQREARRAERVARRRARIERNYGFVHGGFQPTHIDDIVPLMRAAVLIDVSYHPDSYPS